MIFVSPALAKLATLVIPAGTFAPKSGPACVTALLISAAFDSNNLGPSWKIVNAPCAALISASVGGLPVSAIFFLVRISTLLCAIANNFGRSACALAIFAAMSAFAASN